MRQKMVWISGLCVMGSLVLPRAAQAQDTPAAKAVRDRLKTIVLTDVDWKDVMTREILAEIEREADKKIKFKIDNVSGMSNNTRMSYKSKKASVEQILNDLADKNDFGWYVYSNPKDPNSQMNGTIILRKSKYKERGYEEGKEPKKSAVQSNPSFLADWEDPQVTGTRLALAGLRAAGVFVREE